MKGSSMNRSKRRQSKTLEEHSATINAEGVMVRVSCLRIETEDRSRLEIHLEGAGERAAVDLPITDSGVLDRRISQAARGFAASLRLRLRGDRMLP